MIVRHLHTVHELLSVLAQPTAEMQRLRELVSEQGGFPARRTWERRLKAIPATLPAQVGCLGRHLLDLIQPWASNGLARLGLWLETARRLGRRWGLVSHRRGADPGQCRGQ
jgi:hypothetical protein